MRKAFIVLTGILFTLLFATCKQFTADIDDYLSRWSSEAFIQSSTIDKKTYNDGSSIPSVASADKVTITLKVQNPKSFRFVMPSASETRKIVEFAHFAGTKPAAGTDYELIQPSADTLKLVYKDSFLKKAEWGEEDISSTITLYANDGRPPFKQTFTIPLKANTPPPKPGYAVAKTTGTTAYYVLCITVPDMDKTAGGGLLHKDLACIEVNGTPYTFSVDEGQHKFTKPESPFFIVQPDPPNPPNIKKLTDPDADNVPTGGWVLFYKTDVEVKDGAAKKDYTIKLIDKKGLASDIVNASTKPNKPETEIVRITKGEKIPGSGSGSSESDPTIIGTDSSRATLSVSSATANTTVHCTLTEIGSSTPAKYDGNPVTVPLPLNGAGEKKYKLEYYTDGTGFAATQIKTVYYKVAKGHTVTYRVEIVDEVAGGTIEAGSTGQKTSGTVLVVRGDSVTLKGRPATEDWKVAEWSSNVTPSSDKKQATLSNVTADTTVTVKFYQSTLKNPATWKDLARAVKSAPDNATLTINGKIQATDVDADKSEIDIKKNLTIKGENSAILDADGKKGIFDVYKTLTLQDITLTNSKKPYNYSGGAGVYVNSNGKLIMKGSSVITECRAENSGGGVYVGGGTFEMHDSSKITGCSANKGGAIFVNGATVNITNGTLKGNEAAEAGGAIYAQKQKDGPTSTVTISGGTIGGTGTGEKNKVTGKWHFGGGIFVNDDCTLTLNSVQIIGNEAWRAGGVRANRSTVNMTNCTIKNNKTTGDDDSGGGGIYTIKTDSYPVVTISGGTIGDTDMDSANKATGSDGNGGGIYVGEFCTLRLQDSTDSGVRIIGNQAAKGGGVYAKNTIVSMQGRTQIEVDNNDVYLDSGSLISIVESLAATGPVARITVPNDKYQTATEVLTGSAVNTEYRKFTVTPKGSENWTVGSDGQLTNNKTDIFNTITRDQIKAAIKAADPSMIYDDWRNPITNRKAKLTNKLVLYETAQGHYGIMHVTEVDNTTYGGKGHIKFNSKTFNQYGGVLRKETDKVLTGGEGFQFEAGRDPGSNLDFTFGNGTTDEEKTFKPLNGAKFYILSN